MEPSPTATGKPARSFPPRAEREPERVAPIDLGEGARIRTGGELDARICRTARLVREAFVPHPTASARAARSCSAHPRMAGRRRSAAAACPGPRARSARPAPTAVRRAAARSVPGTRPSHPTGATGPKLRQPAVDEGRVVAIAWNEEGGARVASVPLEKARATQGAELRRRCPVHGPTGAHPRRVPIVEELPATAAGEIDRQVIAARRRTLCADPAAARDG